jgi:hypothetical protein
MTSVEIESHPIERALPRFVAGVTAGSNRVSLTIFFSMSRNIDTDTHTHMITHIYKYMHVHPIFINTSEKLDLLDLKIHEVDQVVSYYR